MAKLEKKINDNINKIGIALKQKKITQEKAISLFKKQLQKSSIDPDSKLKYMNAIRRRIELEVVDERHPKIGVIDLMRYKFDISSPDALDWLRSRYPEMDFVKVDEKDETFVRTRNSDEPWRKIDPNRLEWMDIADIIPDVMLGAVEAAGIAYLAPIMTPLAFGKLVAGVMPRLARYGLTSGLRIGLGAGAGAGTSVVRQKLSQAQGTRKEFSPMEMGLDAAMGGAATWGFGTGASKKAFKELYGKNGIILPEKELEQIYNASRGTIPKAISGSQDLLMKAAKNILGEDAASYKLLQEMIDNGFLNKLKDVTQLEAFAQSVKNKVDSGIKKVKYNSSGLANTIRKNANKIVDDVTQRAKELKQKIDYDKTKISDNFIEDNYEKTMHEILKAENKANAKKNKLINTVLKSVNKSKDTHEKYQQFHNQQLIDEIKNLVGKEFKRKKQWIETKNKGTTTQLKKTIEKMRAPLNQNLKEILKNTTKAVQDKISSKGSTPIADTSERIKNLLETRIDQWLSSAGEALEYSAKNIKTEEVPKEVFQPLFALLIKRADDVQRLNSNLVEKGEVKLLEEVSSAIHDVLGGIHDSSINAILKIAKGRRAQTKRAWRGINKEYAEKVILKHKPDNLNTYSNDGVRTLKKLINRFTKIHSAPSIDGKGPSTELMVAFRKTALNLKHHLENEAKYNKQLAKHLKQNEIFSRGKDIKKIYEDLFSTNEASEKTLKKLVAGEDENIKKSFDKILDFVEDTTLKKDETSLKGQEPSSIMDELFELKTHLDLKKINDEKSLEKFLKEGNAQELEIMSSRTGIDFSATSEFFADKTKKLSKVPEAEKVISSLDSLVKDHSTSFSLADKKLSAKKTIQGTPLEKISFSAVNSVKNEIKYIDELEKLLKNPLENLEKFNPDNLKNAKPNFLQKIEDIKKRKNIQDEEYASKERLFSEIKDEKSISKLLENLEQKKLTENFKEFKKWPILMNPWKAMAKDYVKNEKTLSKIKSIKEVIGGNDPLKGREAFLKAAKNAADPEKQDAYQQFLYIDKLSKKPNSILEAARLKAGKEAEAAAYLEEIAPFQTRENAKKSLLNIAENPEHTPTPMRDVYDSAKAYKEKLDIIDQLNNQFNELQNKFSSAEQTRKSLVELYKTPTSINSSDIEMLETLAKDSAETLDLRKSAAQMGLAEKYNAPFKTRLRAYNPTGSILGSVLALGDETTRFLTTKFGKYPRKIREKTGTPLEKALTLSTPTNKKMLLDNSKRNTEKERQKEKKIRLEFNIPHQI